MAALAVERVLFQRIIYAESVMSSTQKLQLHAQQRKPSTDSVSISM